MKSITPQRYTTTKLIEIVVKHFLIKQLHIWNSWVYEMRDLSIYGRKGWWDKREDKILAGRNQVKGKK